MIEKLSKIVSYYYKLDYTFKSVTYFTDQIYALTTEPSLNIYLKVNGSLTL